MFQEEVKFNNTHVKEAGWDHSTGYQNIRHHLGVISNLSAYDIERSPDILEEIKKECKEIIKNINSTEFYFHIYDTEYKAVYHSDRILKW